jgi:quinol-cytochrome oxidoreductase complex cytochrome b subunit
LGGVVAMGASIGILFLMPWLDRGNFYLVWAIQKVTEVLFATDWWIFYYFLICAVCQSWDNWVVFPMVVLLHEYIYPRLFLTKPLKQNSRWLGRTRPSCGLPLKNFSSCTKGKFAPIFKLFFSFWVLNFLFLGVLGGKPVEFPYTDLSVYASLFYFSFFFFFF